MSVPRNDGLLVDMVNEGINEELGGMCDNNFAIQMKKATLTAG